MSEAIFGHVDTMESAIRRALGQLAEPFDPKEIDWRIGQAGSKDGKPWAKVLAYIDARAVMDRLDEIVGPGNWKDRYWREGNGNMCGLSIRVNGEWVEKVDGSEETDIEAFKGGISKALVRAGVKWGIGRYLYNLGDGWANIVANGTKGSRWQPANQAKGVPAFNWLPPELPTWAIPKPVGKDGGTGTLAGQVPGKPNGNGPEANAVAGKTSATTQAIKGRLAGEQKAIPSQAAQGPAGSTGKGPGGAEPHNERTYEAGVDEFFGIPSDRQLQPAGAGVHTSASIPGIRANPGPETLKEGPGNNPIHDGRTGAGATKGSRGEGLGEKPVVPGADKTRPLHGPAGSKDDHAGATAKPGGAKGSPGATPFGRPDGNAAKPAGRGVAQAAGHVESGQDIRRGEPAGFPGGAGAPGAGKHDAPEMSQEEAMEIGQEITLLIDQSTTTVWLKEVWSSHQGRIKQLPQEWQDLLNTTKEVRKNQIAESEKNFK